jgi:hypothetical protein
MKTPMQELIEQLNNVKPQDFCSIETIKGWAKELLEKEKEVMVDFAYKCRNVMAADEFAITHWYHKTFNTKER